MLKPTAEYIESVYAAERKFQSRMYFTLNGERTLYDDEYIMSANLIEEMSALNETMPSNELKISLNNTGGEFDVLNLQNMQSIIASKPKVEWELGLSTFEEPNAQSILSNFSRKLVGKTDINGNKGFIKWVVDPLTDDTPSTFTVELAQANYDRIVESDWWEFNYSVLNNNIRAANMYSFDVIKELTDKYGIAIWQGKTLLADKIALAKTYITRLSCDYIGHGKNVLGNKVYFNYWNVSLNAWGSTIKTHTSANPTLLNITYSQPSLSDLIDANGMVHYICYADPGNGTVASNLYVDSIALTIDVAPIYLIEWIPMGTYTLMEWKTEKSTLSVTMYCRDAFDSLSNINYENTITDTLYNLAVDILTKAGITKYIIDDSLKDISGRFFKNIDSRTALQHIGIASTSAVFQDRYENIVIKSFDALDLSSNYLRYSGQPNLISGTFFAYPLVSTGSGMRYIDFDNMYEVPDITLDKSIYQLVINIYDPALGEDAYTVYTATNEAIGGNNGLSFTLENPLITTLGQAQKVADWYFKENNYNAIYRANWRQNPILECADVVLFEDSYEAKKQTRIYKQEFIYEGYLQGHTESKGGI